MNAHDSGSTDSGPPVDETSDKEGSDSVWEQLRESMERIGGSGRQKSDPAVLARKVAQRAKLLGSRADARQPAGPPLAFLAFNRGSQRYGIAIESVREVQALEQFSPVPKTPAFIPGVVHWRGAILALLDLGKLFELPEAGLADVHVCVVVEAAGRRIAVMAREIEDLCRVPASQVKPAPELASRVPAEWLYGVHDDNRMIVRMDSILQHPRLVDWRKGHLCE